MSKINRITFSNYKFFRGEETINIDGKHLLLYGENGSGKSSIFWGIHTLLEASIKMPQEIEKYFKHINDSDDSLVNIYSQKKFCPDTAAPHYNSFIEIEDDKGLKNHLSILNTKICNDKSVRESRKTTDFINYQSLFAFQQFKNSQSSNIYNEFNESVLPYIDFDSFKIKGKTLHNALDMWQEYQVGPGETTNAKGDRIQVYKYSPEYDKFIEFEAHFNNKQADLIDFINKEAKAILESLGYNIGFELRYTAPSHKKRDKTYEYNNYTVDFVLTHYNGEQLDIKRPHKFLNEAKLTAIAIAIRLAVLRYKLQHSVAPEALNVLALDDIMVSLDMSNRDKLTDLIIKELANSYQIILLTHDKGLYNFISTKISQYKKSSLWIYKKMYVGECEKTLQEYPVVVDEDGSFLERAKKYFQAKDFTIAALYLRKALEKMLVDSLPPSSLKNIDDKYIPLEDLWKKNAEMYKIKADHPSVYELAAKIKRVVLNPAAHYKREDQPLYRKELKDAFKFIDDLGSLNLEYVTKQVMIEKGQRFVYTHPTANYSFEFELESNMTKTDGKENDPRCIIHTWQYNGVEYHNFVTGEIYDSYKSSTPKFSRLKQNLYNLPLSINEANFMADTIVDGCRLDFILKERKQITYSSTIRNTEIPQIINDQQIEKIDNIIAVPIKKVDEEPRNIIISSDIQLSDFDIERLKVWTSVDNPQFFQIHFEGGGCRYGLGGANQYEIKNGKEKIEWNSFFEKLQELNLIDIEKHNKEGRPVYQLKKAAYDYVDKL